MFQGITQKEKKIFSEPISFRIGPHPEGAGHPLDQIAVQPHLFRGHPKLKQFPHGQVGHGTTFPD